MIENRPKAAVCVILRRGDKVLLGKRRNSHGEGTWGFPGGHLEYKESFEDCAARELMEETGLHVENMKFGAVTNSVFEQESKHYVTIFMIADSNNGEPENLEPDKCHVWEWHPWTDLPKPLFLPIIDLKKIDFDPLSV